MRYFLHQQMQTLAQHDSTGQCHFHSVLYASPYACVNPYVRMSSYRAVPILSPQGSVYWVISGDIFLQVEQTPENFRTMGALRRTVVYLRSIMDRQDMPLVNIHKYLWDRFRAVRQDLFVQGFEVSRISSNILRS